jgi:ubiquinone/menaquinone biosynthesis C-methylase UbiE
LLKLSFDEDAEKIIRDYLRDFEREVLKFSIKPEYAQTLLFELEHQIRLHSLKVALRKGSKIIGGVDIAETLKAYGSPKKLVKRTFRDAEVFDRKQLLERYIKNGCIVLDAGCGWGRFILRTQRAMLKSFEIVGVDIDDISLKYGKGISKTFNVIKSEVERPPFKNSVFDVILCSGMIHEIKTSSGRKAVIEEFQRVIKPCGILCIVDFFSTNPIINVLTRALRHITSKIEWFSLKSTIEKLLKRNMFEIIEFFEIERRAFGMIKVLALVLTKK